MFFYIFLEEVNKKALDEDGEAKDEESDIEATVTGSGMIAKDVTQSAKTPNKLVDQIVRTKLFLKQISLEAIFIHKPNK